MTIISGIRSGKGRKVCRLYTHIYIQRVGSDATDWVFYIILIFIINLCHVTMCNFILYECVNNAKWNNRGDSAKMDPLSLYGLFENFNVQIREGKSHHLECNYMYLVYKIPKTLLVVNSFVYEIWRHFHQRVKGSILPHNRSKMYPQFLNLWVQVYTSPWPC